MSQVVDSRDSLSSRVLSYGDDAPYEVICEDTVALGREGWLELRRTGLGGSDVAAAMGLSPFTSRYALWLDKVGEPTGVVESEPMKWGHRLEEPIARAFAEETGHETVFLPVMMRSRTHVFALANPDRFTVDDDGPAIVEIKNVGNHKASEWQDGPPLHYRMQGQWYLFVSGHRRVYYAVLVGGQNLVIYQVERDDALIAEMLRHAEAFWTLVTLRRPPDLDGEDSTTRALKAQYTEVVRETVDGGTELAALVTKRESAKALFDTVGAQLHEIDNRIIALLGDAEAGLVDGVQVVRRPAQTRTSVDIPALKRDYPEIAERYVKSSQYRVMKFPTQKESK